MSGTGARRENTSSRIREIQDSRAVDADSGRKTYTFAYDDGVVPHLLSITSHIDKNESCQFAYEAQRISPPFGGNGNKGYEFVHVLKSIQWEGHPPQTFEYSPHGELHQAQLPYGACFRWEHETANNQGKVRGVSRRGLALAHGKEEAVWEFGSKQSNGRNARHVTTMTEPQGMAKRIWSFDADAESEGCGLLGILEEKDRSRALRSTAHLWKRTVAGVPYIGTVETTLDPGTAEETTGREEFDRDLFGNLTEDRKYDYGNSSQPIRVVSNTYMTDPAYIERGIYDLLLTSTIGDGTETTEQIRNHYDTTPLAGLQDVIEHDPEYGTGQTIRGNLTESVVGDVYSRIKYDIAGVVDSFEDGIGSRVAFSGYKQENLPKLTRMIPDNDTILGLQTMLHMNFKPKVTMPLKGVNIAFKDERRLQAEGSGPSLQVQAANTLTKITSDGRYTFHAFDDFQRLCATGEGNADAAESVINYEWGHAPNAPLGSCLRASLPHAPDAKPEWVTYEYDALGRLVTKDMLSHGGKESFAYKGNSKTAVNARGGWKKYSVDPAGRLRKVTAGNPDEGSVTETDYQYNHQGRLKAATLPRSGGTQRHTFAYDGGGRLLSGERAESGREEHRYNADGRLASRTDAKGQRTAYSYDSKKRLVAIKRLGSDGQIRPEQCVAYYYDHNPFEAFYSENPEGRLAAAQWGDEGVLPGMVTEMYSYSRHGLVTAKRIRVRRGGRSVDIDLNYTYNDEGRIAEISYTGGQPLTYEYDSLGRQAGLTSGGDVLVKDAAYSPAGHLASFKQLVPGTGEYIAETRTIGSTCQTHRILAERSGNPLVDVEYEYSGEDGRLIAENDRLSGERTAYAYDSAGRLKAAESRNRDWDAGFEYDGFGNLSAKRQKNGRGRSFAAKHNPKTNRAQMSQVEYDANGNMTNHFGTKLRFDIENRLVEVRDAGRGVERYAYDKDNLRIWKKSPDGTEEFHLYGTGGRLLATYRLTEKRSGDLSLSLIDGNVYFANRLVRSQDEAVVLDRTGNVKEGSGRRTNRRMRHAPFGEDETASGGSRGGFGTYRRDEASGLDYAKRRYYSSELGRFISPDPYIGSIRLDDPDSWNRYAYCGNDPVNNVDPNGTACMVGIGFLCDNYSCPMYSGSFNDYYSDYGSGYYVGCNYYNPMYGYMAPFNYYYDYGGSSGGSGGGGGGVIVYTSGSGKGKNGLIFTSSSSTDRYIKEGVAAAKNNIATNYLNNTTCLARIGGSSLAQIAQIGGTPMAKAAAINVLNSHAYEFGAMSQGNINAATVWYEKTNETVIGFNNKAFWGDNGPVNEFYSRIVEGSISQQQLFDLVYLHELSHLMGRDHPEDEDEFNRKIWGACFTTSG
jgi:RHS repeat-associated protein